MNLLCLNCRGCGRSEAVREIRDIADNVKPMVLFLSETKMSAQRSQELRWRLGFPNAFGVNRSGLSGGLCLMWKIEVSLDIKSYSKYHIDSGLTTTLRQRVLGTSRDSMGTLFALAAESLGECYASCAMKLTSRGFALAISMKSSMIMNNLVAMIEGNG